MAHPLSQHSSGQHPPSLSSLSSPVFISLLKPLTPKGLQDLGEGLKTHDGSMCAWVG